MVDPVADEILHSWLSPDYGRRQYRRWQFGERGVLKFSGAAETCLVQNISPGGACISIDEAGGLTENAKVVLELEGVTPLIAEVRSAFGGKSGLAFLHDAEGERALAHWLTLIENSRRRHRRKSSATQATFFANGQSYQCVIRNVSLGGAEIEGEMIPSLPLGGEIELEFGGLNPIPGTIQHKLADSIGIKFEHGPETLKALIQWLK